MEVFVTVGMGRWPFDRLVAAVPRLAARHRVFAQIGVSDLDPGCPHERFVPFEEVQARVASADVVVTHAGNTVRLVQRAGKVPVAVARQAGFGEMGNDHQVEFLRHEQRHGRVVPVWDVDLLATAVDRHAEAEARILADRPPASPADGERVADLLDDLVARAAPGPFARHPLRRYAFAHERLAGRTGRHLDVGFGSAEFLAALAATTDLECHGVDAHPGYVREAVARHPDLDLRWVPTNGPLPFGDGEFSSVSVLDVLEHVPDEDALLREVRRVLAPGGRLVLTVPRRHVLSFLDPDNAKFRFPRLHRAVYSRRFGPDVYHERFVDLSDGLRGDLAVERDRHDHYRAPSLGARLEAHGFRVEDTAGANLLWRLLQTPALLTTGRVRRALEALILVDGTCFSAANLFLTAARTP